MFRKSCPCLQFDFFSRESLKYESKKVQIHGNSTQEFQCVLGWGVSLLMSSHRLDELINQPLRHVRLLNDALLVVLANGAAQFIVVHRRTVFPDPPQFSDVRWIFNFKNSCTWEKTRVNFFRSSDHGVIIFNRGNSSAQHELFICKENEDDSDAALLSLARWWGGCSDHYDLWVKLSHFHGFGRIPTRNVRIAS